MMGEAETSVYLLKVVAFGNHGLFWTSGCLGGDRSADSAAWSFRDRIRVFGT